MRGRHFKRKRPDTVACLVLMIGGGFSSSSELLFACINFKFKLA